MLIASERAKRAASVSKETEEEIKKRAIEEYLASQKKEGEASEENKEDASKSE